VAYISEQQSNDPLLPPPFPDPSASLSQSVGGLNIVRHPELRDLSGLSSLGIIKGSLVALGCASLTSLRGLNSEATSYNNGDGANGGGGLHTAVAASFGFDDLGRRLKEQQQKLVQIGSTLCMQSNPELRTLEGLEVRGKSLYICMYVPQSACISVSPLVCASIIASIKLDTFSWAGIE
jgi:hypothetical protein